MEWLTIILTTLCALGVGIVAGRYLFSAVLKQQSASAQKEARRIIGEAEKQAESMQKAQEVKAKERFLEMKSEFEEKTAQRKRNINERESRVQEKERTLKLRMSDLEDRQAEVREHRKTLTKRLEFMESEREELEKLHNKYVAKLERIAKLDAEDAKKELSEMLKKEAETEAMSTVKQIVDEAKVRANKEAKKVIIESIQRTASEQTIENTVSVFNLESDDAKGQIIGREGRNIRALEAATGVEFVIDDTPEAVLITGFDPVRREVARLSLQRLLTDGRVHPARIEEVVAKTKKEMEDHIVEVGERTVIDLGIHGLHGQLVRMVGRMRFRSSYGQNLLQHSRETANLSATMASELGLNAKLAKRAGLLHDIGKVPEDEPERSHAILGMKLAEKYGEHEAVCNAIGAHHDEIEMKFAISPVVQACDAISGARPGARRETAERYVQRLKDLEDLAMSFEGVVKAYAIQAGRELRIMVESEKVSDKTADEISFKVSQRIQDEMQYPGQVKVTVIRERRAISYAK